MTSGKLRYSLLLATAVLAGPTQAALYDRGNGMIYDDVLDITWLQDANYAKTSGYDSDGVMTWSEADAWARQLVYGGYSNWRLASARLQSPPISPSSFMVDDVQFYDGSWDIGYNITRSELGHMFYNNLNNLPDYEYYELFLDGVETDPTLIGLQNTAFIDGVDGDTVSFINVQAGDYWYQEEYSDGSNILYAWYFGMDSGDQWNRGYQDLWFDAAMYSWAVRDGDVSTVPVPTAAWLFGSALLGLLGWGRARR